MINGNLGSELLGAYLSDLCCLPFVDHGGGISYSILSAAGHHETDLGCGGASLWIIWWFCNIAIIICLFIGLGTHAWLDSDIRHAEKLVQVPSPLNQGLGS